MKYTTINIIVLDDFFETSGSVGGRSGLVKTGRS